MGNLFIMTFDNSSDAIQVHSMLHQLQEISPLQNVTLVLTKDEEGKAHTYPLKDSTVLLSPSADALEEVAPGKEFVQKVFDALPHGQAALFVDVGEGDYSATFLTILLLISKSAIPKMMPVSIKQNEGTDARFRAVLEAYQAAVANLEALRADSTEVDIEAIFKTVEDAYNRLISFITGELGNE